jgi:hypothetical protein
MLAVDGDTPLGVGQVGGCNTLLSANLLFQMIRELQVKEDLLTECSKNTGMIFGRHAFASKAKFAIWFTQANPSREGLAGFINIISIWAFGGSDSGTTSEWLHEVHGSKSLGLKGGGAEVSYAHSMAKCYPIKFVGKDKTNQISATTRIKMLESHATWMGNGLGGDGVRNRLDATLATAIWCHQQYCEDNFPDGDLKSLALRTADATRVFWSKLGTYIDNEHLALTLFDLISKHILLLLSNQVVQICKDLFKLCCMASNIDVMNNKGVAAARYAWVTLQAHRVMEGYLTDKFWNHLAITGCFVCFLTCHMTNKLTLWVKSNMDKLEKELKELKAGMTNKVSAEMFNCLDSKLTKILRLNPTIRSHE